MEGMKCFAQMFSTVYGRLENLGKQTNISRGIKKTFRAFSITDVFFQIYLTLCLYPTNINLKKKQLDEFNQFQICLGCINLSHL